MFGPTVSPQLVQSGKGRIASDPALLNLPRPPTRLGPFSVYGSGEQMFGADEQVSGRGRSDQEANAPMNGIDRAQKHVRATPLMCTTKIRFTAPQIAFLTQTAISTAWPS